jgi:hypothetical protein
MADLTGASLKGAQSPFPWLSAGSMLAGPLLGKLFPQAFGGQIGFDMPNPADHYKDLVLTDSDIARMRSGSLQGISEATTPLKEGIKQAGAATGNTAGTQTALADLGTNIGKSVTKLDSDLIGVKKRSYADYFGLQNQYQQNKMNMAQANANSSAGMMQQGLGGLSQLLMLWQGGMI